MGNFEYSNVYFLFTVQYLLNIKYSEGSFRKKLDHSLLLVFLFYIIIVYTESALSIT